MWCNVKDLLVERLIAIFAVKSGTTSYEVKGQIRPSMFAQLISLNKSNLHHHLKTTLILIQVIFVYIRKGTNTFYNTVEGHWIHRLSSVHQTSFITCHEVIWSVYFLSTPETSDTPKEKPSIIIYVQSLSAPDLSTGSACETNVTERGYLWVDLSNTV